MSEQLTENLAGEAPAQAAGASERAAAAHPNADPRAAAQAAVRALRGRIDQLSPDAIALILSEARSHYAWTDRPVPTALLHQIYEITAQGATSMNGCPARFRFITSTAAKDRLAKALKAKNIDKMRSAPVTVIVAHDLEFWRRLDVLFPHEDRRPLFAGKPAYAEETAFRNATLQGGYMMIAARALGLDVGAMSGFDNAVVDQEFFAGTTLRSNFLINMGYADETALFQKLPRFDFQEVCEVL